MKQRFINLIFDWLSRKLWVTIYGLYIIKEMGEKHIEYIVPIAGAVCMVLVTFFGGKAGEMAVQVMERIKGPKNDK